jgi:hypothetical protein
MLVARIQYLDISTIGELEREMQAGANSFPRFSEKLFGAGPQPGEIPIGVSVFQMLYQVALPHGGSDLLAAYCGFFQADPESVPAQVMLAAAEAG